MTRHPDAVIFDCDGVLLESAKIKTQAFADLFSDYPEHVDDIVALHEKEGGLSRYVKFDMIHDQLLGLPLSDERRRWLGEEYSRLVVEQVMACDVVPGTVDLLDQLRTAGVPMFVSSGSPQDELDRALAHHGLADYFDGVWGHPTTKPEAIAIVLDRTGAVASRTLFVGDAWSDFEAAHGADLWFLGRVPTEEPNPFPDSVTVGGNLSELTPHILEDGVSS